MTKKHTIGHPHPTPHEVGVYWIPADPSIPMAYKLVEPNYPAMMNLVGGWLEKMPFTVGLPKLDCGCPVVMMVNEEAKLQKESIPNDRASFFTTQLVLGDVFLVAEGPVKSEEEDEEDCINHVGLPPLYHHWSGPGTPLPAG